MHDLGQARPRCLAVPAVKGGTARLWQGFLNLLEDGMSAAIAVVGGFVIAASVVVIENQMLAFVSDDV